jgi:hypothetical protein
MIESATTAAEHAERASSLLAGVDRVEERLEKLTPEEHLQASVQGGIAQANKNREYSVQLAIAHALTSLALRSAE